MAAVTVVMVVMAVMVVMVVMRRGGCVVLVVVTVYRWSCLWSS